VASRLPTRKVVTDDGPVQDTRGGSYRPNCAAQVSRGLPGAPAYRRGPDFLISLSDLQPRQPHFYSAFQAPGLPPLYSWANIERSACTSGSPSSAFVETLLGR
jgi:hypothetical protein